MTGGDGAGLIAAADTHELRRAVLRSGDPDADVMFAEDDGVDVFHVGVRDDGAVVAVGSFSPQPVPGRPDLSDTWQVRGMAVVAAGQGRGLGSAVLAEGVDQCRARGGGYLWANARDAAQAFYSRHGFEVVSDGFCTEATGLPHHRMLRRL